MPQDNEKNSNSVRSRTPTKDHNLLTESDSKDQPIFDRQKDLDVKGQEDLEACKGADDMPELKNDQEELMEDEQITLDLCEPPPEVVEYARRELGETEEVKCQTLQEFRDMIYRMIHNTNFE